MQVRRVDKHNRSNIKSKKKTNKSAKNKVVTGSFVSHQKGFGFVVLDGPGKKDDLFIPIGHTRTAMTGDRVSVKIGGRGGKRGGKMLITGEVLEILARKLSRCVGTLGLMDGAWFAFPDGDKMTTPVLLRKTSGEDVTENFKVVVDIIEYAAPGKHPVGEIVETLGPAGVMAVETLAIIRAHDLRERFPDDVLAQAQAAADKFKETANKERAHREDLSGLTVITIDPDDARDYDDAVSLQKGAHGTVVLGVHIADVAHFVQDGTPLDKEALERGTSVYLPKKVVPMLPESLSNGVCSLVEGEPRLTKSVFITYDSSGEVVERRFCESSITSTARLTYRQAQSICDGKRVAVEKRIRDLVRNLEKLARKIEKRRLDAGMLHLNLPEVDLVFDKEDHVVDAKPTDDSYTHTIIEMFMVEANEAVAFLLLDRDVPFIGRVHPDPDEESCERLEAFARACGYIIPKKPAKQDVRKLLGSVAGKPCEYAMNLAVLRSFSQAEYSAEPVADGTWHFALASSHYCHFTSPIRRYPDLTVHRLFTAYCRGQLKRRKKDDLEQLKKLAVHCNQTERKAQAAEYELRNVLVLQYLKTRIGDVFDGTITGVADFGVFIQSPRFLVEGLIRLGEFGKEWWDVSPQYGLIRGETTGTTHRIGDVLAVRIAGVDLAKRHLDLALD
jgi:ribonuclease R